MLRAIATNQFEKDIKLAKKRGKDLNRIFHLMQLLLNEEAIPVKHRDHNLSGTYANQCDIATNSFGASRKNLPRA